MNIKDKFKSMSRRNKIIFGLVMVAWLIFRVAFLAVPVIRSCMN